MTTHWFLLADYMDLEAKTSLVFCMVPRQLPTLSKRSCRIILRNIYSSLVYSEWLSKVWKARCEKVSKQSVKSLAASLSLPRDLLHAYPWTLCAWLEENTHVAHAASKHSLLQAGVFRATGENQSPQFKKTHFTTTFHFFCQICLLRSKIPARVTNITAQEWKGSTCLVGDASTPLEIISWCHSNRCGNSWGWTCF